MSIWILRNSMTSQLTNQSLPSAALTVLYNVYVTSLNQCGPALDLGMLVDNGEALSVCSISVATQVVYKFKLLPLSLESCALVLYLMVQMNLCANSMRCAMM